VAAATATVSPSREEMASPEASTGYQTPNDARSGPASSSEGLGGDDCNETWPTCHRSRQMSLYSSVPALVSFLFSFGFVLVFGFLGFKQHSTVSRLPLALHFTVREHLHSAYLHDGMKFAVHGCGALLRLENVGSRCGHHASSVIDTSPAYRWHVFSSVWRVPFSSAQRRVLAAGASELNRGISRHL